MPDLSAKSAHLYWKQYPDPLIYRVVCFMQGVEKWVLDGDPAFEAAMAGLGKELDNIEKIDFEQFGQKNLFIKIGNTLSLPRNLRLLQALDMSQPGSAAKLLMYAEENSVDSEDETSFFLRRNIAFERLRLLARIFAPQRIALVSKALEGE